MTLQFDTAVPSGTPAANCVVCKAPVGEVYYTAGKAVVCAPCKTRIETSKPVRPTPGLVARSTVFGMGGAILGALLYYIVMAATGYEIALVAIAVGFIVGRAVQMGAKGQRGRAFQIAAVALTYLGIGIGYVPQFIKDTMPTTHSASDSTTVSKGGDTAAPKTSNSESDQKMTVGQWLLGFGALGIMAIAVPVLATFGHLPVSLITGLIIAVGLRQAWYMNRPPPQPVFHGPFKIGARA